MDYYEVLGVTKQSTPDEIKRAYRNKAKQYHPDVNKAPDAAEKVKAVNEAYGVLGDEAKRRAYDEAKTAPFANGQAPFANGQAPWATSAPGASGFTVHFHQQAPQNTPVHCVAELDASATLSETRYAFTYDRTLFCPDCKGAGGTSDGAPQTCTACNGTGYTLLQNGPWAMQQPCNRCGQKGHLHTHICKTCSGIGRRGERIRKEILLPLGCVGKRYVLQGCGNQENPDIPIAPLVVDVRVKEHPCFAFRGDYTVFQQVSVDPVFAMLGGVIKVKSIDGSEIECTVPFGSSNEAQVRIPAQGLYNTSTSRADMVVQVICDVPKALNPDEKAALKHYLDLRNASK